jgi:hypothetical protein
VSPEAAITGSAESHPSSEDYTVRSNYEGLPAAGSVEQAIALAQLQILRQIERQRQVR